MLELALASAGRQAVRQDHGSPLATRSSTACQLWH